MAAEIRLKRNPELKTVELRRERGGFGIAVSGGRPPHLSFVSKGSSADRAGLSEGDYVLLVNGRDISKTGHEFVNGLISSESHNSKIVITVGTFSSASRESSPPQLVSADLSSKKWQCLRKVGHQYLSHHSTTTTCSPVQPVVASLYNQPLSNSKTSVHSREYEANNPQNGNYKSLHLFSKEHKSSMPIQESAFEIGLRRNKSADFDKIAQTQKCRFMALRLGSFSFQLNRVHGCADSESVREVKKKLAKKVNEAMRIGVAGSHRNKRNGKMKCFVMLELDRDEGVSVLDLKGRVIVKNHSKGLQLWSCKEMNEHCFSLVMKLDFQYLETEINDSYTNESIRTIENGHLSKIMFACHVFYVHSSFSDQQSYYCSLIKALNINCSSNFEVDSSEEFPKDFDDVRENFKSFLNFKKVLDNHSEGQMYAFDGLSSYIFTDEECIAPANSSFCYWQSSSESSFCDELEYDSAVSLSCAMQSTKGLRNHKVTSAISECLVNTGIHENLGSKNIKKDCPNVCGITQQKLSSPIIPHISSPSPPPLPTNFTAVSQSGAINNHEKAMDTKNVSDQLKTDKSSQSGSQRMSCGLLEKSEVWNGVSTRHFNLNLGKGKPAYAQDLEDEPHVTDWSVEKNDQQEVNGMFSVLHSCLEQHPKTAASSKPPLPPKKRNQQMRTPFSMLNLINGGKNINYDCNNNNNTELVERCQSTPPILEDNEENDVDEKVNSKNVKRKSSNYLPDKEKSGKKMSRYCYDSDPGLNHCGKSKRARTKENMTLTSNNTKKKKQENRCAREGFMSFDGGHDCLPDQVNMSSEDGRQTCDNGQSVFSVDSCTTATSASSSASSLPPVIHKNRSSIKTDEEDTRTRVASWAVSFDKLLSDELGLTMFREFLKKEFNLENLTFWSKCEEYKKLSDDKRKILAKNIFEEHISAGAIEPVNVDHEIVKQVKEELSEAPLDLFRAAQLHIYSLMKQDIYPRFKKSGTYKEAMLAEIEGRSLSLARVKPLKKEEPAVIVPGRQKMAKRGKSLLFWHRRKLTKASTNPDMKRMPDETAIIDQDHVVDKIKLIFPDNSTFCVLIKNYEGLKSSLRDVLIANQDKFGHRLVFYEVVDAATGQVIDLESSLGQLPSTDLRMIRCVVFCLDIVHLHVKCVVKCQAGRPLRDSLKPILKRYSFEIKDCTLEIEGSYLSPTVDVLIDVLDCKQVKLYTKIQMFEGRLSKKQAYRSSEKLTFHSQSSPTKRLLNEILQEHITRGVFDPNRAIFDDYGICNLDRLSPVKTFFKSKRAETQKSASKSGLFSFMKKNAAEKKKQKSAKCLSLTVPESLQDDVVTVESLEPTFDDEHLLDLIYNFQCRGIDNQRHGASYKSMPSFLRTDLDGSISCIEKEH